MFEAIRAFLGETISGSYADGLITAIIIAGIGLAAVAVYWLTRLLLKGVEIHTRHTENEWDDHLLNRRLLDAVSQLTPALVVNWLLPGFFDDSTGSAHWIRILTSLYILWAYIRIVNIFADNLYNALFVRKKYRRLAVKGLFQTVKVIAVCIGILLCLSLLFGRGPVAVITGLGATAGILMLVFRDTILGFVASVQLTGNNMLHVGDWIVAEKYGANGEVQDITLTTVKVLNWDNSISTIPPYSLISDSFRNYQNMRQLGGRRVERSIYIDVNTVRFCTPAELQAMREKGLLEGIALPADGQPVVNLYLLRHYLQRYIDRHPGVNHAMLAMVRQMEPTQSGLPLELYFFLNTVAWKEFEIEQSDIFDHVFAITSAFGLRLFQTPSGRDFSA